MQESYIRLGLGGRHAVVDVVVCWASCWEDYEGRKEGILHFLVSIPAQAIDAHGNGNGNGTLAFLLGKIGLIASKDRYIRKIPRKFCRSVK